MLAVRDALASRPGRKAGISGGPANRVHPGCQRAAGSHRVMRGRPGELDHCRPAARRDQPGPGRGPGPQRGRGDRRGAGDAGPRTRAGTRPAGRCRLRRGLRSWRGAAALAAIELALAGLPDPKQFMAAAQPISRRRNPARPATVKLCHSSGAIATAPRAAREMNQFGPGGEPAARARMLLLRLSDSRR